MVTRGEKPVCDFTYMDWVLDAISGRLISVNAKVGEVCFSSFSDEGISLSADVVTPSRTYFIQVFTSGSPNNISHNWSVTAETKDGTQEILATVWNGVLVKISPNDETALFSLEPYKRDFLIADAKTIGDKIGNAIAQNLYDWIPEERVSNGHKIEFNAFSEALAISRKHGTEFFLDLFDEILKYLPDLKIVGPILPTREREFYLTFTLLSAGNQYVLSSSCMVDDNNSNLFGDSNWHMSKNFLWDENVEWIGPGYYSPIHNYKGKRLRNELSIHIVDTIRHDLGLPRISESGKLETTQGQKSKHQKTSVQEEVSIWDLVKETFNEDEAFLVQKNRRSSSQIETPVHLTVIEAFTLTNKIQISASVLVGEYVKSQWLTWENQHLVIRKATSLAPQWSKELWENEFPEFDAVVNLYRREGQSKGSGFLTYAWFGSAVGLFVLFLSGNPIFVATAGLAVIAGKWYSKINHLPSFFPTSLSKRKKETLEEITKCIQREIEKQVKTKVHGAFGFGPEDWASAVNHRWQPLGPRPLLPGRDITPLEAENLSASYLKFFGFPDVSTTRYSRDGGVDVYSQSLAVQVKHQQNPVGVKVVREIYGVAKSKSLHAAVFTRMAFTKDAIAFAQENDISLFSYDPHLVGHSSTASKILEFGANFLSST